MMLPIPLLLNDQTGSCDIDNTLVEGELDYLCHQRRLVVSIYQLEHRGYVIAALGK